jgi:hypothetical protein
MKWITPLWSDPVGWSEKVAKTKLRVFMWTLIHLCFVSVGFFMIYWSIQAIHEFHNAPSLYLLAVLTGAGPILFIGVGYPAMYLYAMHRLLVMLKAQDKAPPDEQQKS